MREKVGRNTLLESGQVLRIWQELKRGNSEFEEDYELCYKCNGVGWRDNHITGKGDECPECKGFGFTLKETR